MHNPAILATRQIVEAHKRWSMWLLRGTDRCEAYECDFCEDVGIAKRLKVADVVVGAFLEEIGGSVLLPTTTPSLPARQQLRILRFTQ
jgi:hypothetical protein